MDETAVDNVGDPLSIIQRVHPDPLAVERAVVGKKHPRLRYQKITERTGSESHLNSLKGLFGRRRRSDRRIVVWSCLTGLALVNQLVSSRKFFWHRRGRRRFQPGDLSLVFRHERLGFSHGVVGQKVTGQEQENQHERGGQDCETQLERLTHLASLAYPSPLSGVAHYRLRGSTPAAARIYTGGFVPHPIQMVQSGNRQKESGA